MAETVEELINWARQELRVSRPWTIVRSQTKLRKTLFEFEDEGRRYVGKISATQSKTGTFGLMKRVWDAGMKPPSPYQITEPVAWLPERSLLIAAKAPGRQIIDLVSERDRSAVRAVEQAGAWIRAMQSLRVDLPARSDLTTRLDQYRRELNIPRAAAVLDSLRDRLEPDMAVPSHGDCHPMNLYFSADGRVTAIDLDTLSLREPAFDVAGFYSQLAIMGYHALGSFEATSVLRQRFLACAPSPPQDRFHAHVRFALIRSLHYDLCLLKLKKRDHVGPFLNAAEHGLDP
jgi:hypothetical protein